MMTSMTVILQRCDRFAIPEFESPANEEPVTITGTILHHNHTLKFNSENKTFNSISV